MIIKPNTRKNATTNTFTVFAKFIKFFLIALIVTTMAGSLYVAKIVLEIAEDAPEVNVGRFLALNEPSIILDNEGNQMDILHTDEVRFPLDLEDMGQNVIDAFISIEDERFEKHKGVDYRRTIGVTIRDIVGQITGNRDMQGGSTLTQQMIKNTFLSREQKYERKIKEIFMALQAEKMLTKDQILETYLNSIYLGGRANGVEAAARQYFNKSANELSIIEAAYIAGATQSPSYFYAFSDSSRANPSKYIVRTKLVLNAMLKNEKITAQQHEQSIRSLDENEIEFFETSIVSDKYNYEYFTRPVEDQVKTDLKTLKGYTDEEIEELFAYGGLVIHSTMDRDAQEYAQSILADYENINATYMDAFAEKDRRTGEFVEKRAEAEAAFAAVDYKTGQVQVLVGGRDDSVPNSYNRAYYDYLRPIGSTTKPITVYGPALETGAITLGSPALDKQLSKKEEPELWREADPGNEKTKWPSNYNSKYTDSTSIRKAIVNSYNTVSVRTFLALGNNRVDIVRSYGEKYGLTYAPTANIGTDAYAMGGNFALNKDGGNPLVLAGAYGMFGNSGIFTENILYTKVTDSEGNIILEKIPKSEQILSAQNAYLLYDVMKDIVKNNVPATRLTAMPVAGKTGTATTSNVNEQTDLWFAGLSPYYSAAIWFGSDNPSRILAGDSNRGASSYVTQYAFGKIMAYLNEGHEIKDVSRPQGITTASFCTESGGIPNEQCYIEETVASDLFVTGTQPKTVCDVHTYIPPVIDPIPEEPVEGVVPTPRPTQPVTPTQPVIPGIPIPVLPAPGNGGGNGGGNN